ncbi:MAG: hypothetical protein H8E85_01255 [Candidatus Marinimicrobia bacterium]|nr:hypothetical protein [Candidatus Neomarinimicrobiota bacterium]
MKEKMTITLVCAFIIGLAYFGSFSIESSKSEDVVIEEITPVQFENQPLDYIFDDSSETDILDEVELEIELTSMNSCVLEKMDTDLLSFSEAFGYFRQCLGSDSSFQWKGSEYTTLLSEEVIINVADSVSVEETTNDSEISQIR